MIAYPFCDCPVGRGLTAEVTITMQPGWEARRELANEEGAMVTCAACGRVLKPPYTLYRGGQIVTTTAKYVQK